MRSDEQRKGRRRRRRRRDKAGRENRWRERVKKHEGRGETEGGRNARRSKKEDATLKLLVRGKNVYN